MFERYAGIQKFLHWTIALLVIGALAAGQLFDVLKGDAKNLLYATHKAVGVLILGLMLLRVLMRLFLGVPGHPVGTPAWQTFLSGVVHASFYALIIAMPIIGWIATVSFPAPVPFFGLIELNEALGLKEIFPKDRDLSKWLFEVHEIISKVLIGLITLHIVAALYHAFVKRDGVLRRMWFGRGTRRA